MVEMSLTDPPWWPFRVIMDDFLESKLRGVSSVENLEEWMITFTQIMAIRTPGISMQDHLKQFYRIEFL